LGIVGFGHMYVNNVVALNARHPPVVMAAPYTREWNKQLASWEDQAGVQPASITTLQIGGPFP